jgi:hypothetical protein
MCVKSMGGGPSILCLYFRLDFGRCNGMDSLMGISLFFSAQLGEFGVQIPPNHTILLRERERERMYPAQQRRNGT